VTGQPQLGPAFQDHHLNARLTNVEDGLAETRSILRSVDESLKSLVRLEAHHAETREGMNRAFKSIKVLDLHAKETDKAVADHARRLKDVEEDVATNTATLSLIREELPKLRQSAGWVNKAVLGAAVLVGGVFGTVAVDRIRAWLAPTVPQVQSPETDRTTSR
jgi:hypothetical protein